MSSINLPLTRPYVGDEEKTVLTAIIGSGWLTQGSRVTEFEDLVAKYVNTKYAIACSNCTAALHIALLLNGIGPGDEVIVPSYTWIATANVVRMVGAMPVFADIDLDTFNIAAPAIEMAITERTRAIMLVHQFGLPADMESIIKVAQCHRLVVIEDAACALGSLYEGKRIGSSGNVTCFSFHPRKVITTGEGGMLVTDDAELASRARVILNHGAASSNLIKHNTGTVEALLAEEFHEVGYNYRMTNLQGALGVTQMERLDEILALRRMRAEGYTEALTGMPYIIPPQIPDYATPNWQSYTIRISDDCPVTRNAIAQHLLEAGIACRPAYMACHVQPVYREFSPDLCLPNTEKALSSVLILPLFPQMTEVEQHYVVEALRAACQAA